MAFIYSTLSCPQRYTKFVPGAEGGIPREEGSVLIHGGANVADRAIITPRGVVTEVSDEELALLKENKLFNTHCENGFITIETKKVDVEKVTPDMEARDGSAPLTPGDFEVEGKAAPSTGKASAKKAGA